MLGRLIGKIIAAPIRIVNLPVKVIDAITDPGDGERPISGLVEEAARAVERASRYVCGEE